MRARFQRGYLRLGQRKTGCDCWEFLWWDSEPTGQRVRRKAVIGTVRQYPTLEDAWQASNGLRVSINQTRNRQREQRVTFADLIDHYIETELACHPTGQEKSHATWDLAGGTRARLSVGEALTDTPVWSADGRTLYFGSSDIIKYHEEVREVPADGSQPDRSLIKSDNEVSPADTTSDGKWLLYEETENEAQQVAALKASPLAKGLEPFTVLEPVARLSNARLKPRSTTGWLISRTYPGALRFISRGFLVPVPSTKFRRRAHRNRCGAGNGGAGDKLGRGAEEMSLARGTGWLCLVKSLDFHRASDGQARSNPKVRLADHLGVDRAKSFR